MNWSLILFIVALISEPNSIEGLSSETEDLNLSLRRVENCYSYLRFNLDKSNGSDDVSDEKRKMALTRENMDFFALAGNAVGKELGLSEEEIRKDFQDNYEEWLKIVQSGLPMAGLSRALETECYEGGSIYDTAKRAIVAAGLDSEAAKIFAKQK